MIRSVIKTDSGVAIVFDERGKQIPGYQGKYEQVRERILEDASPDTVFYHDDGRRLKAVPRKEW